MVSSRAVTPAGYLAALPADKRAVIAAVRNVVNAHLPPGYVEGIQYGMLAWYVPLATYPDTYNGQPIGIASLAAQKNHLALYLLSVYGDAATEAWFRAAFAKAGKKLDMGKSCVRFEQLDDLPLDVIGEAIARVPVDTLIARHEAVHGAAKRATKPTAKAKPAAKAKPTAKAKPAAKAKPTKPAAKPTPRKR